jgi:hypothetical protein
MTTFQVVCLLIGAVLLLSNVVDFRKFFAKKAKPVDNGGLPDKVEVPAVVVPTPAPVQSVVINNVPKKVDNTKRVWKIVKVWEQLRDKCEDYGLKNSTSGLDQIFPTFLEFLTKERKSDE